jgi:vacuolar-type H+-ATPase subunit D/Vma8
MKQKLKGAQTGHSLLKRKSEALTKRFRDIVKKIDDVCVIVRSRWERALNQCAPGTQIVLTLCPCTLSLQRGVHGPI